MKHIFKKTASFLLCLAMIFGCLTVSKPETDYQVAEARTLFDIEDEIKEYKALLSQVQAEVAEIAANISELEGKTGETAALLIQYQADIDALEVEIMINESIMDSYDIKRAEITAEIAVVQEDYDYRISMYKKMMQYIYENSDVNSFELLFSSKNFADYLTRRDNYNDIMKAANKLLKEIEVSIADLKVLDQQLLETQSEYDEYLKQLAKDEISLATKIEEFETIAADLNLDSEELSQQYKDKNQTISEIKTKLKALEEERKKIINSNKAFIWPVKTSSYRVTSQFGWRGDPFGKPTTEYHKGIDIACSRGVPIVAVKDGVVTRASEHGGYGECVIVYHGDGISSLYAHCDNSGKNGDNLYPGANNKPTYAVKVGDNVKAGQVLAFVGTTGRSTGNHLHFGVINTNVYDSLSGNYVNPNKYLPDGYYTKKS